VNTRSLKFRLVVWYAGLLAVLFLVFGIFVYFSLGYYLKEALREALARRARQVTDLVQRSPPDWPALGHEIQSHFAPEANNRLTRVNRNGIVIYVSGPPADRSFDPQIVPLAASVPHREFFDRRTLPDGKVLLIVSVGRVSGDKTIVVEEGSAEAPLRATLHQWLLALVIGLAVLITGAVVGGFLVVQRALRPVDRIIESAARITSQNLSRRLPVPEAEDELQRLSTALNHMIARLEDSFQHTKRFLADASHELRTPLTMLQAELEAIIDRSDTTVHGRERAASALEEVERLRKIVEGLFALSRLDAGEALEQSAHFDLSELAASTAEQMSLLAEDKKITLTCHASEKVVMKGDRSRLKQVVVNLLDNAVKYTPSGGRIDMQVRTHDSKAVLEVSDTGVGIPPEAVQHVFERFFRVDKARSRELGGAGLGLSIVKSICAAHHATVRVESKPGEGSRFIVELPLV
jgi:heavy metal sensor kinase